MGGVKSFTSLFGTYMALESGEVNVRNEKDRLSLKVSHHFEDGHIVSFLQERHFDIHN